MKKHLTTIPFSGFYHSVHDYLIDQEIEQLFSDDQGDCHIPDDFWTHYHAVDIFREYAKQYVQDYQEFLKDEFDLDITLEFDELNSPREYNFTTDRIFCYIHELDLIAVYYAVLKGYRGEFEQQIKNSFTSCDGFISHYSNDIDDWFENPVTEWDHNEIGTLFNALDSVVSFEESTDFAENMTCNGELQNIVCDNLPERCLKMLDEWEAKRDFQERQLQLV